MAVNDAGAPDLPFPDIYADGAAVNIGDYGATITFTLSEPPTVPVAGVGPAQLSSHPVARIRLSPQLATKLAQMIEQVTTTRGVSVMASQATGTEKH